MSGLINKRGPRDRQLRDSHTRWGGLWRRVSRKVFSWSAVIGSILVLGAVAIALAVDEGLDYSVGQKISQPVYAKVAFQVPDRKRTQAAREAARAKVPNHYVLNDPALTSGRIRADMMRLFQIASEKQSFEEYEKAVEAMKYKSDRQGYERFRELADRGEEGLRQFQEIVDRLSLEDQYVVGELALEDRNPQSTENYIILHPRTGDEPKKQLVVPREDLAAQKSRNAIDGVASSVSRRVPDLRLRQTVEYVVAEVYREQPTVLYDKDKTTAAMKKAEDATPEVMTVFEANKPFIHPGLLEPAEYELLLAHQDAYEKFLREDHTQSDRETRRLTDALRREQSLKQLGLALVVAAIALGLLVYAHLYEPRLFHAAGQQARLVGTLLATMVAARLLEINWPQFPELALAPVVAACGTLAIAYPRRLAIGVMCFAAVMLRTMLDTHLSVLLVLLAGIVTTIWQLDEIRSRSKLLLTGLVTGLATAMMSASVSLWDGQDPSFVLRHAAWAGGSSLLGIFALQGLLPFLERGFRVATSLTLLEWRDPTRPLLQLLAREAPGTYNHSLVLGTLAEAACERIGANGLLAQVGALYHDIGKIHRAAYFTENQEGRISRHENLAPSMSLLIILGHVKDGLELARQYRLPPVLHQFIAEHHGTTLVRYFHHRAVENQPRVATGRHDRDVSEADFRYEGPRPQSRESAVLMLCDAVEGAVRALNEPTVGRIESTVHQMIVDRLNDGQFDDCAITMRDIRQVEDSLVKSLCGIHHGRVAYPKARKEEFEPPQVVAAAH